MPDGRVGTVVYNGLDGVGIKWGRHKVDEDTFSGTFGNVFEPSVDVRDWPWHPDAILRDPWPGCERYGWLPEQCEKHGPDCLGYAARKVMGDA
jgi:hypothetical protein